MDSALLFLGRTKWNLAYLKFGILSQKSYNSFHLTGSIQNLCGLFEMDRQNYCG